MTEAPVPDRRRTAGRMITAVGFLMILANALGYLFGWGLELIPLWLIGLALVAAGLGLSMNG